MKRVIQLVLIIISAFYSWEYYRVNYISNYIIIPNSRFGDIKVFGASNTKGNLIVSFFDNDKSDKDFQKDLVKNGQVVAEINLETYLKNVSQTPKQQCYEFAGEVSRLSQIIQNAIKMTKISNSILLGSGDLSSSFVLLIHQYLKSDFYGSLSINLHKGDGFKFEACENQDIAKFYSEMRSKSEFPKALFEKDKKNSNFKNFRYIAYGGSKLEASANEVGKDFLTCKNNNCPLLDLFLPEDSDDDEKLPVVEIIPNQQKGDYFIVFLSGDGGWASIDKEIGGYLSKQGIPVIGFDCLKYFWKQKNPDKLENDISSIISEYQTKLNKHRVILIGFSLGANMVPFILSRLPEHQLDMISYYSMLSPSIKTEFEVHFTDWIPGSEPDTGVPITPELSKIPEIPASCIRGIEEESSLCDQKLPNYISVFNMNGSHHFDGDYKKVSEILIGEIQLRALK